MPVLGLVAVPFIAAAEVIRRDQERRADAVAARLRQRVIDAEEALARQQRLLSDSQQRAIRDAAQSVGPRELMIRPRAGDPESIRYAEQIADCLRASAWSVALQEGMSDQIIYGVYLRHWGPDDTPEPVAITQAVLAAGGLSVPIKQTRDREMPRGKAMLVIGHREDATQAEPESPDKMEFRLKESDRLSLFVARA